ncbi:MAG: hypothetical protein FGF48_03415 [Candidatus Brockarchaeota archaeon]|nr:hypothetical protein [Candidatus Brockarchaeota archaeon]
MRDGMLRIGAAQVDITPKAGIQLAGNVGVHRPAQVVSDPLFSKALVLECERRKACFITLDLCIATKQYCDEIRRVAAEKFGFDFQGVMVHSLQIHSAPSLGHFMLSEDFEGIPLESDWLRGGDERYNQFAVKRILESIRLANEALEPVQVGVGSGVEGRMAFNRRAVKRDGTVMMPWFWDPRNRPLGFTEILYLEGPMDPELGIMCFRTDTMRFPAMIVNYTCHPVVVYGKDDHGRVVSADWPGALAEELRKTYGADCVLVFNGACGNINPWNPFDPDYRSDHLLMGRTLAETAKRVVEKMVFREEAVLDWKSKVLKIPVRKVDDRALEEARRILENHPEPVWIDAEHTRVDGKWYDAALLWSMHLIRQREPELGYEVQVFRIGDAAFVSLPGEPFVEGGLRIKMASPAGSTYIVHCTNQYVGYIPTMEAFKRGGHEVKWSRLVPEALDLIVEAAINLLNEVFSN